MWVDTEPKYVEDFAGSESTILEYEIKKKDEEIASLHSLLEKVSKVESRNKPYEETDEDRDEDKPNSAHHADEPQP